MVTPMAKLATLSEGNLPETARCTARNMWQYLTRSIYAMTPAVEHYIKNAGYSAPQARIFDALMVIPFAQRPLLPQQKARKY
ncbi:Uncharacterised protein [Escherichia coli]|uniref:Uncharacterized protein n=1 Tax=Escherichia coli TaxID=562 RepID=A0A2X1MIG9_ECOLX|nr:Uncharacterised protein [Escherichia coli]